jgi:hypothetical protein
VQGGAAGQGHAPAGAGAASRVVGGGARAPVQQPARAALALLRRPAAAAPPPGAAAPALLLLERRCRAAGCRADAAPKLDASGARADAAGGGAEAACALLLLLLATCAAACRVHVAQPVRWGLPRRAGSRTRQSLRLTASQARRRCVRQCAATRSPVPGAEIGAWAVWDKTRRQASRHIDGYEARKAAPRRNG